MDTLGERLKIARKKHGFSQYNLGEAIGVSRGVIFNLEKDKTEPQTIVINAICQTLKISKDWLLTGLGNMEEDSDTVKSAKILAELYEIAQTLSEDEQLFILDTITSLKNRLGSKINESRQTHSGESADKHHDIENM